MFVSDAEDHDRVSALAHEYADDWARLDDLDSDDEASRIIRSSIDADRNGNETLSCELYFQLFHTAHIKGWKHQSKIPPDVLARCIKAARKENPAPSRLMVRTDKALERMRSSDAETADEISVRDFYAYMPAHQYIFVPSREMWPAASGQLAGRRGSRRRQTDQASAVAGPASPHRTDDLGTG
jgi:hypothetical protein